MLAVVKISSELTNRTLTVLVFKVLSKEKEVPQRNQGSTSD